MDGDEGTQRFLVNRSRTPSSILVGSFLCEHRGFAEIIVLTLPPYIPKMQPWFVSLYGKERKTQTEEEDKRGGLV